MRAFILKLLKTGVPVAVVSAAIGYGVALLAGPYADAQAGLLRGNTDVPSERMQVRMPLALGATSFAVVVAFEGLTALLRRNNATPVTPTRKARVATESGMDAEVEAMLNGILAQTEAAQAAPTPASGSEAPGTGGPRNLSTAH